MARLTIVILVLMSGTLANAAACTIHPDVTAGSFTRGSGYGIIADEYAGMATFNGTAGRQEFNAPQGIQTEEADVPGAEAYEPFVNALESTHAVNAAGIVRPGNLSNNQRDHSPVWNPSVANVGFHNSNGIPFSTPNIGHQGSQMQIPAITPESPRESEPIAVPEPSSLLLLGTGFGALGLVEYRRKKE